MDGLNTLVLMIVNFSRSDIGSYVCRAKNLVSQDAGTISLWTSKDRLELHPAFLLSSHLSINTPLPFAPHSLPLLTYSCHPSFSV